MRTILMLRNITDRLYEFISLSKTYISEYVQIRNITKSEFLRAMPLVLALAIFMKVLHRPQINSVSDGLIISAALTNLLSNLTLTARARSGS